MRIFRKGQFVLLSLLSIFLFMSSCQKKISGGDNPSVTPPKPEPLKTDVTFYLTTGDRSSQFSKQNTSLLFSTASTQNSTIEVDETKTFQSIDGFGYTLTGGSASLINALPSAAKESLLKELFLTDSNNIGISYLRISVGASDLSAVPFTYDDMSAGQTDPALNNFTIGRERTELIPVLKQIIALYPDI